MAKMFIAKHDGRRAIEYIYPTFEAVRDSVPPVKKILLLPLISMTEAGQGTSALFLVYAFLWVLTAAGLFYLVLRTS
ncbi:MAG: hypothetical protein WC655_21555, partial [Candidatus Hydrogenedentales bacterium]